MKQTEKILGVLILILMISRLITHYPFSNIAIAVPMLLLSLIYFFLSFGLLNKIRLRNLFKKESYIGISTLRLIGTVITGFVLSMLVNYALFKFQAWPMGDVGLLLSLILLSLIIVVVLVKFLVSKKPYYYRFLKRLGLIGVLAFTLYFITAENLLELKYRHAPEYIEAKKKSLKSPENKELQRKAQEERMKI